MNFHFFLFAEKYSVDRITSHICSKKSRMEDLLFLCYNYINVVLIEKVLPDFLTTFQDRQEKWSDCQERNNSLMQ